MKQDPSRGGGSTVSPAYSAALERLAKKRLIGDAPLDELPQIGNAPPGKRSVIGGTGKGGLGIVGDAFNMAKGIVLSPVATVADIAWKPFEAIPGAPDFNPEDAGTVNLFVQGGKSLQHVYGDAKELGRSIITGKDTLSESPSAKAYQAAGGGLEGALMAAAPYLDVGSVVAPMALGAARGAGLVAPKPVPYTPLTASQVDATRPMTPYRTTRNALAEDMAQAQQNVVPLFPEQPPSPGRLRVTNAKLGQSDVTDLASYREARDPTLRRFNKNAGDDLYPVGTEFVGKPGAPGRDEAMRNFNAFSQVYEFKFDPKDGIDIEDFIKEGVSAENYDLFMGLLTRAESYKIPRSEQFKVALANFVQRMGGDAVIVNDELILVPRGKTFKDYFAEDEFGLSAIDITPTNRRTMNPVEELASAKTMVDSEVMAPQAARVAPGFIMPEPVPVGNIGKLPSGVDVQLATPEQSVAFVAEQGALDQVPTEHLWRAITENAGSGKRYEQIGSGGGVHGMDRFLDTSTGQYLGLKYTPAKLQQPLSFVGGRTMGYQQLSSPFRETMANEVGVSLGIPDMGTRTIVNAEGSPFLITELAQSVYGKDIRETFQAGTKSSDGTPAIANLVTVDSRIRKALLDDLLENRDAHQGNQLFVVADDGTVSIIPIDLEQTFDTIEEAVSLTRPSSRFLLLDWGRYSGFMKGEAANFSLRNRMYTDSDGLRNEIVRVIKDVQENLSLDDLLSRLNARRDETLRSFQNASGVSGAIKETATGKFLQTTDDRFDLFIARMQKFLDTPANEIADAYMAMLQKGIDADNL